MIGRLKRGVRAHLRRRRAGRLIAAHLASQPVVKIMLGAGGSRLDGWLATDTKPRTPEVAMLDIRRRFPFGDGEVDYFIAEHVIEHVTLAEGLAMLRECRRCLKPGGRIRVATPDLLRYADCLSATPSPATQDFIGWSNGVWSTPLETMMPAQGIIVMNRLFRKWGHSFIYDPSTLQRLVELAGFVEPAFHAVGESGDLHLRGVETRAHNPKWVDSNAFQTMVIEAKRP